MASGGECFASSEPISSSEVELIKVIDLFIEDSLTDGLRGFGGEACEDISSLFRPRLIWRGFPYYKLPCVRSTSDLAAAFSKKRMETLRTKLKSRLKNTQGCCADERD